jgi:hypothetical protein
MSAPAPLPLESPNWRPLHPDAIVFVCQHLHSVERTEEVLKAALDSGDLPSILERVVDGRVVRERMTYWKEIEFKLRYSIGSSGTFSGSYDDIEITRGLESLEWHPILVWWPAVERLCGLAVAQPTREVESPSQTEPLVEADRPSQPEPIERLSLKHEMILAIIDRGCPEGWDHVQDADLVRLVEAPNAWEEELARRGVDPKQYPRPGRTAIANAVKRRRRRS